MSANQSEVLMTHRLPFIKKPAPLHWVSLPFPLGSGTASSSHRSWSISRDTNTQFSRPTLGIVSVAGRASGRPEFPGSGAGNGWFGLPPGGDIGGDIDGRPA